MRSRCGRQSSPLRMGPASSLAACQPGVSQSPGFVAGYWTRKDNTGLSMIIFDSEDAANQASEQIPSMIPDAVTLDDVELREVAAHA